MRKNNYFAVNSLGQGFQTRLRERESGGGGGGDDGYFIPKYNQVDRLDVNVDRNEIEIILVTCFAANLSVILTVYWKSMDHQPQQLRPQRHLPPPVEV